MTANQIAFAKVNEDVRHNKETERQKEHDIAIGLRNAIAAEMQGQAAMSRARTEVANLQETHRANLIRESLQQAVNTETQRSNLAKESETNRSNVAREAETKRANLSSERLRGMEISETSRRNTIESSKVGALYQQASAAQMQAQASMRQADVAGRNATTQAGQLMELRQHNAALESIAAREATVKEKSYTNLTSAQAGYYNAMRNKIEELKGSEKFKNYASVLTPLGISIMKGLS